MDRQEQCEVLLDTDIDQIVQWLKQGDNATTICANLDLCPGPLCGTCALVFGVLDEILPSGAGEVRHPHVCVCVCVCLCVCVCVCVCL